MTKTAEEVEREVEASRSDLDRTVEALKDKMTPGQIFDEATKAMGGAGQQVLSKFVDQAKENPMPLAVMGLGLIWLMSSSAKQRSSSSHDAGYREPRSFAGDGAEEPGGLGERAQAIGDKASSLAADAKDKLSDAASSAADRSRSVVKNLGAAAGGAASKVGRYGQQAQRSLAGAVQDEPLLIGAAGVLIGAAIGAALPSTDLEDRTVGPLRDKVLRKGKDLAEDGLQQAGDVAHAAYGSVKEELQKPTHDGDDPVQRAKDVARGAVQAGRAQLDNPPT